MHNYDATQDQHLQDSLKPQYSASARMIFAPQKKDMRAL